MSMYKKFLIAPLFLAAVLISVGIFINQAFAGSATLSWTANTEPDLAGYRIYYGTSPRIGTCPAGGYANNLSVGLVTTHTFNSLTDGQTWYFSIAAYDTSNNVSCFSPEVSKVLPPLGDTTSPTTPSGLSATTISSSQINLSWTASTDNIGVTGYRIYRGGVQIATTTLTTYSNTGLSPSTSYSYTVAAYDAAGNVSAQSLSASATTLTQTSTSWTHAQTNAQHATVASNALAFSLNNTLGNLIVAEVNWSSTGNFVSISDSRGNTYTQIGTEQIITGGNKSRLYYAKNITSGANTVTTQVSGTITSHDLYIHEYSGLDTINPLDSYSFNNAVSGASFTSNNLTTTATNDLLYGVEIDVGLGSAGAGWTTRSTLNGNVAADRNAATVGTYAFTGTSGGSGYTAWVASFKQAGASSTDATSPTTPSGLSATTISSSQINLSWTASTDNIGVTGYRIYRGGVQIATTTLTTYSNTGLSPSTSYSYTVAAYDVAGNVSSLSTAATATTQPGVDVTAPSNVSNLSASNISFTSLQLNWTAPGNDGGLGTATSYDIRYSTAAITLSNWASANQITGEPAPLVAGTAQSMAISGLTTNTAYYFAIRTSDSAGNTSGLSNVPSATTQSYSLSVSVSATPSSGVGSLSNVSLTASVSGSQVGNINYTFYCNRSDSGTNITLPYNGKYDNQSVTTYTASNLCSYSTPGTYTAKVITERGMLQAQNTVSVTVSSPTYACSDAIDNDGDGFTDYPTDPGCSSTVDNDEYNIPASTGGGGSGGGGGGGGAATDTTPPSVPSNTKVSMSGNQIVITWSNPTDTDFRGITIVRKQGSSPTSRTDGNIVYNNNLQNFIDVVDSTKTFYYALYSYDANNNYSQPVILKAEPGQTSVVSQPAPTTPQTSQPSTSGSVSASITVPSTVPSGFTFTSYLTAGKSGDEVRELQEILASNPAIYPEGTVTGYYGPATQRAVQRFQEMNGIAGPSTAGYGDVGPSTRSRLNYYIYYRGTYSPSTYSTSTQTLSKAELIAQLRALIAQIEAKILDLLKQLQARRASGL